MADKINSTNYGLDLDSLAQYIKEGDVSYALNANIQSNESSLYTYTTEPSNILCSNLPTGYVVMNTLFIREQNKTIYFLVNPTTGESEIGYIINEQIKDDGHIFQEDINKTHECKDCGGDVYNSNYPVLHTNTKQNCLYIPLLNNTCLNFSINHPIKSVYKILDCGTLIYFVDGLNNDRYLNLNKLPFKKAKDPSCVPIYTSEIDCNLLNFYPNISIPQIQIVNVLETGSLEWGSYQFVISYSNINGDSLTKYFALTNILPIAEPDKLELDFGKASNKSIQLNISSLEKDAYQYYNLYVIKTVRNVSSLELIDTFPTTLNSYTYTGNNKTQLKLPIELVFKDFPFYKSNLITSSNGYLMRGNLKASPFYNWQKVANKIKFKWITYRQKYEEISYKDPISTTNQRTFQRDEVYALSIVFFLINGEETCEYPCSSREKNSDDREMIPSSNLDNLNITGDNCRTQANTDKEKWMVYNTATITKTYPQENVACISQPYQEGEFAYWESTEKYPCNSEIWGDLAGKPIRHFKFPDNSISHIHDSTFDYRLTYRDSYYKENYIYPIGVKIDENSLSQALLQIPLEERALIRGYKIIRANRANNKSVIAKGLLYNVGTYDEYNEKNKKIESHYYPNYPFNDLNKDPFLYEDRSIYDSAQPTILKAKLLNGFQEASKQRYTFHSPDTHFYNPGLGTILKLETEETGIARSTIKEVEDHAKYKFLTLFDNYVAYISSVMVVTFWAAGTSVAGTSIGGAAGNPIPMVISVFQDVINIIRLSIPYRNFCYQVNSVGNYNSYLPIPNAGNKQRVLDVANYLSTNGFQYVQDDYTINQYHRESSVYLKTDSPLPFPNTQDHSRYYPLTTDDSYNRISSYYGSVKRMVPDQYSSIDNMDWVDTGHYGYISEGGQALPSPIIFGGDTFITKFALKRKVRYFSDDRVGFPNEADIDFENVRNLSNPIYYFNTSPPEISDVFKSPDTNTSHPLFKLVQAFNDFMDNVKDLGKMLLRIPKNNLDEKSGVFQQKGRTYLFNYGIPYFFVESDVNTEYRFAENDKDRDYYPRTSAPLDIPHKWLQEKYVPIVYDNSYIYNKDYSKQMKEHAFSPLPSNYTSEVCKYVYPNRVAYSEQSFADESYDRWLIYKANNFYDFPRENGALKIIKGIENVKVLAVFENTFSVYNAYSTVKTSNEEIIIGNGGMFQAAPLEYSKSEVGYGGTDNSQVYITNFGTVWIDSKRSKIYQLSGKVDELSSPQYKISRYLSSNLQFKIKEYFPSVDTDNAYKGIGFSMGWDEKNSRIFITKLDYEPVSSDVIYDGVQQVFYDKKSHKPISLTDTKYFCNKSFTLAFKEDIQRWVSFYSFLPNFYTSFPSFFSTGERGKGVHNHLLTNKFYHTYYGVIHPYILEYVVNNGQQTQILQSVAYSQEIKEYYGDNEYYSVPDGSVNFNKAIIYNDSQSSGVCNLVVRPESNLKALMSYPKFNPDSLDILYTFQENKFSFNTFWDITKNFKNRQPIHIDSCTTVDKALNPLFHDYSPNFFTKNRLRGQYFKVRLINDDKNRYKFINFFNITQEQPSN